MIASLQFRKHFVMTTLVIGGLVFLAFTLSIQLTSEPNRDISSTPRTFAHIIDSQSGDPITAVRSLNDATETGFPYRFDMVDASGRSLLTNEIIFDQKALEKITWPETDGTVLVPQDSTQTRTFLTPLAQIPNTFLLVQNNRIRDWAWRRNLTLTALFAAILVGSGFAVFMILNSFRKRTIIAIDDRLRETEKTRIGLIQELAHDLRTPMASLRNLIETLSTGSPSLDSQLREELFQLAVKETDYLTQLVEDLLFLAQVMEPKSKPQDQSVSLTQLLVDELELMSTRYPDVDFEALENSREILVEGHPHLLKRLIRNALDNAASYARSKVSVRIIQRRSSQSFEILVLDDGPGLSPESLSSFGKKRSTRYMGSHREGRLSVGLGSVIMTTIAQNHEGSVEISNQVSPQGQVTGALLRIVLPAEKQKSLAA